MIAGGYPEQSRIVRTWPGPGTGDSYFQTEDGQVWVSTPFYGPPITGVTYGSVEGDRIVSPPRSRAIPLPPPVPIFSSRPQREPPPEEPRREVPRAPRPRRAPAVLFVGAGPMHRRWR